MSWAGVRLGDVAEFRNGVNFNANQVGSGVKIINVKDFGDRWTPGFDDLSEVTADVASAPEAYLQDGDILIVRSNGNRELIGRVMFIEKPPPVTHSAFTIRIRVRRDASGRSDVLPKFLGYSLRGPLMRRTLVAQGGGTNISNVNQAILSELTVPVPNLTTQRKIVAILGSLEGLLANNA